MGKIQALLGKKTPTQSSAMTKKIIPLEYFEGRANDLQVALIVHTLIMPEAEGIIKIPGLQFAKSIGDAPDDIFDWLLNEELVLADSEHFSAECRKCYSDVHHVMTGGFNRGK